MYESDANNSRNFHTMPDHIKKILYLDAPDIIVEFDSEPIFSIEVTSEAGTGHNSFQRFARLAASVENNVPTFYVYPEATIVKRKTGKISWDRINPLIFKALEDVMSIYNIPALLYYFPSDFKHYKETPQKSPNFNFKGLLLDKRIKYISSPDSSDDEMQCLFSTINEIIQVVESNGVIRGREKLLSRRIIMDRRALMNKLYISKGGNMNMSPLSATTIFPTQYLLNYLSQYENSNYEIGELLRSRDQTIAYKIEGGFRGDPYPGALAAIDYLRCRQGKSFEERKYNLIMVWGELNVDNTTKSISISGESSSIHDFINAVKASEAKNILNKSYDSIENYEIPRYYMQVRYGSTFSKNKHIRVYSYFADAILFKDGSLWRDA